MLEIPFAAGMLLVLLGWIVLRGAVYWKTRKICWPREAVQIIFLINLLVIYRFTFHPFAKADGQIQPLIFEAAAAWPFRVNPVPFVHLLEYDSKRDLLVNLIGNFAMFIPTGIVLPLIYRNRDSLKQVFLTGLLMSLTIEVLQLPFAVRASDVDDLILNTAGCLAGYGILCLVRWLARGFRALIVRTR